MLQAEGDSNFFAIPKQNAFPKLSRQFLEVLLFVNISYLCMCYVRPQYVFPVKIWTNEIYILKKRITCLGGGVHTCHSVHVKVRGQVLGVCSLLLCVDLRHWIQVVRLCGKCPYPLSHFYKPHFIVSISFYFYYKSCHSQ